MNTTGFKPQSNGIEKKKSDGPLDINIQTRQDSLEYKEVDGKSKYNLIDNN